MRTVRWVMGMAGIGLSLMASRGFAQGSLTPPGGPAETMKTLDQLYEAIKQVEPRTPITNLPYTVTQPGSYYLTANLTTTGHGINIMTSRVTLDLMGFSINGDRGTTDNGINVTAGGPLLYDIVVKGGIVSQFGSGLYLKNVNNARIEGVTVSSNAVYGVYLLGWQGKCNGNTISKCAIGHNSSYGVHLDGTGAGQCNDNAVVDCSIHNNGSYGLFLIGTSGDCSGNVVKDNRVSHNAWDGIDISFANDNRIENNHISRQIGTSTIGIWISAGSTNNFVLRNSCVGQTNNYSLPASTVYGPIVTDVGALPTNGAGAHPWANFSR